MGFCISCCLAARARVHWLKGSRACGHLPPRARASASDRPPKGLARCLRLASDGRAGRAAAGGFAGGGHVCVRDTRVRETRRRRARRRPGAPRGARRGREARDFRCVGRAEAPRGRCGRQGDRWGEGLAAASRSLRRKQGQRKVFARAPDVRLARNRGGRHAAAGLGHEATNSAAWREARARGRRGRPDAASCGHRLTTLPPGGARARVRARDTG